MDTRSETLRPPTVSITMATYNRASYIGAAIESVRAQSYTDWELIIVDDGSTDTTADVVTSYQDPRIQYIKNEHNSGIVVTRMRALTYAQGTYIAVIDSDDLWNDSTKLATQVTFLEEHPDVGIVGTFIRLIDEHGVSLGTASYGVSDYDIRARILGRNQFAHSSVLIRRSAIDAVGGYLPLRMGEDLDLFLRLGTVGAFANIPTYMTSYRIHASGMSRNGYEMAHMVLRLVWRHRSTYPNAFSALIKSVLRLVLASVHDTRMLRTTRQACSPQA